MVVRAEFGPTVPNCGLGIRRDAEEIVVENRM